MTPVINDKNMTNLMNTEANEFANYCKNNSIEPISQDKVVPQKVIRTPKIIFKDEILKHNVSQFDNSFSEYYVDGQKLVARNLRLGNYKIVAWIDLHNHTQISAMTKLEHFITHSATKGNTCLKIIHGKGLNSSNGDGILKHMVRRYLEQNTRLLAYTAANPHGGGDGVTLVKLKN